MKKILYAISAICLMTMTSCQTTISDCKTEIDDAVRFYLASVELMARHVMDDSDDVLIDELFAEFPSTNDKSGFKSLLIKKKEEGNLFAQEMLGYYEGLSINISEPVSEETESKEEKVWSIQEINSQVNFRFRLNVKEDTWNVVPKSEEDIDMYMWRILLTKKQSEDDELQQIKKAIKTRIKNQYSNRYNNKEIMSGDFYSVFSKAQEKDESEVGWPDWNIWDCSQCCYAEIFSINVEVISKTNSIAHVILFYPENGKYLDIDFPMVYENGDWYVDDIQEVEEKYSLKESAQKIILGE